MVVRKNLFKVLRLLGILFLQLVMTQLITFLISLLLPGMGNLGQTQPILFAFVLGITFSFGVFLAGWLAFKLHWLDMNPKYPARLLSTLISAYLPLIIALLIYPTLEPGNPFFAISIFTSILGFYIPEWIK